MLSKTFIIILVIIAVLAIGMILESRRERSLRAWIGKKVNTRLHWPFKAAEHAFIPAIELTQLFIQRPPIGWASAVQITEGAGEMWFIEFRTTPLGKESSDWFNLIARRGMSVEASENIADRAGEEWKVHGPWSCQRTEGLITVSLLEETLSAPRPP